MKNRQGGELKQEEQAGGRACVGDCRLGSGHCEFGGQGMDVDGVHFKRQV